MRIAESSMQPTAAVESASRTRRRLRAWVGRLAPFLGLFLVIAIFASLTEAPGQYLSTSNLRIVLSQTVIVALGAIGMTVIIISGGIDLSAGSVIALAGVVTALSIRAGWPPLVAIVAATAIGGVIGLVNGLVITGFTLHLVYFTLVAVSEALLYRAGYGLIVRTLAVLGPLALFFIYRQMRVPWPRLRVVPFIATLGMLGIARGVAKWLGGEQTVNAPPTWINNLARARPNPSWLLLSPAVWLALFFAVLMAVVLRNTVFGRRVFALGSNEAAARACGINTNRLKLWVYGTGGLFIGLAGVIQMSRLGGQGDPTVAIGTELDIIAAAVIGGASLNGGEGTILGSMIGALVMAFLRNGCQQMGWPNYIQEIIIGAIIVLAVAVDRWRHSRV